MKLNLLALGLLIVASTSWTMQIFTIWDDDLSAVPHNAEVIIRHTATEDDDLQRCEDVGEAVDLDGDGHATDLMVTMQDAAPGQTWVLRHAGDFFVIALSDLGHPLTINKEKHKKL